VCGPSCSPRSHRSPGRSRAGPGALHMPWRHYLLGSLARPPRIILYYIFLHAAFQGLKVREPRYPAITGLRKYLNGRSCLLSVATEAYTILFARPNVGQPRREVELNSGIAPQNQGRSDGQGGKLPQSRRKSRLARTRSLRRSRCWSRGNSARRSRRSRCRP